MGHYAGELMQMSEVVNGPCCEKLRKSYRSEGRMLSSPGEILRLQVQSFECGEAFLSEARELVKELI
jgi:hypothetical protein